MKDGLENPRFLSRKTLAQTSNSYGVEFSWTTSPTSRSPDRWKKQKQQQQQQQQQKNNNKTYFIQG